MIEVIYPDRTNPSYLVVEIREGGVLKSFKVPKANYGTIAFFEGEAGQHKWLKKMALAAHLLGESQVVVEIEF